MKIVGVLGLQGAVREHLDKLEQIEGISPRTVKYRDDLLAIDALIIPGGESTAIGRLLKDFGLSCPISERIRSGMPVWGTCAGMVLLAKKICNDTAAHLAAMDIEVMRNAYGRQLDSFTACTDVPQVSTSKIPLVFIRAPYVTSAAPTVEVLLRIRGNIVACRQDNMLATSFHPELTSDLSFHRYFANMLQSL